METPPDPRRVWPQASRALRWLLPLSGGLSLVVLGLMAGPLLRQRDGQLLAGEIACAILAALLASALLLMWTEARRVRRHMAALSEAVDLIGAGKPDRRLPLSGENDAIDGLAMLVNRMVDRLAHLRSMLADQTLQAQHESGNSAGRMGLLLRRIRDYEGPLPPVVREAVEGMEREQLRFETLTTATLNIWRARQGIVHLHRENLAMLLGEVVDGLEGGAHAKGIDIKPALSPAYLKGDASMLTFMLVNLLGNAIKYTPHGGTVAVGCAAADGRVRLTIADSGPGIPSDKRDSLFETGQRLESGRHEQGHGLGLTAIKVITDAHDGVVGIRDSELGGACFHLEFSEDGGRLDEAR